MKRIGEMLGSVVQPDDNGRRAKGTDSVRGRDDPCPICKGKGYLVYDVPAGDPNFNKLVPCRCTQARLAAERANALRAVSNLGQLDRMTFDNFLPDGVGLPETLRFNLRRACELSLSFARAPKGWLVLQGGYGSGKTHLAAAIANFRLALGEPTVFVVVPDLLDHLRATYAPTSTITFDERFESVRDAPLLILDDLGSHNSTAWAEEKLFQILNYRYNGRLPTVITTNQQLEELEPRLCSRLVDPDMSQVYEILAPDFRVHSPERSSGTLNTLALHGDQTFEAFKERPDLPTDQQENLRAAVTRARAFAEDPAGWLVFYGTYGCGKTHLAAAIANYQVSTGGRAVPLFVVVPDLLDHLRSTFSPTSTTTLDKVFDQVRAAPLLILDDLGTESATPWAREKLFQLFNHRYAARLPTVITSANSIEEMDPRIKSRMLDPMRCTVFAVAAPAYRGEAQKSRKPAPRKGKT